MSESSIIEDAAVHPWKLGCATCQREAEERVTELEEAARAVLGVADETWIGKRREDLPRAVEDLRAVLGSAGRVAGEEGN